MAVCRRAAKRAVLALFRKLFLFGRGVSARAGGRRRREMTTRNTPKATNTQLYSKPPTPPALIAAPLKQHNGVQRLFAKARTRRLAHQQCPQCMFASGRNRGRHCTRKQMNLTYWPTSLQTNYKRKTTKDTPKTRYLCFLSYCLVATAPVAAASRCPLRWTLGLERLKTLLESTHVCEASGLQQLARTLSRVWVLKRREDVQRQ